MSNVESLQFFKDRIELAGPNGGMVHPTRSQDRTVQLIKKWQAAVAALRKARSETMFCLSAVLGNNKSIKFEVVNQEHFDQLQEEIKSCSSEIAALEAAMRRLDEMGGPWFGDLEYEIISCKRTPIRERQDQATRSGALITKNFKSGKPPAEILGADAEFVKFKARSDKTIEVAEKKLVEIGPNFEEVKALLESAGC